MSLRPDTRDKNKCKMTGKDKKLYDNIIRQRNKIPRPRSDNNNSKSNTFVNVAFNESSDAALSASKQTSSSSKRRKILHAATGSESHQQSSSAGRTDVETPNERFVRTQGEANQNAKKRAKSKKVTASTRSAGCTATIKDKDAWERVGYGPYTVNSNSWFDLLPKVSVRHSYMNSMTTTNDLRIENKNAKPSSFHPNRFYVCCQCFRGISSVSTDHILYIDGNVIHKNCTAANN